jgi:hypothetical protein
MARLQNAFSCPVLRLSTGSARSDDFDPPPRPYPPGGAGKSILVPAERRFHPPQALLSFRLAPVRTRRRNRTGRMGWAVVLGRLKHDSDGTPCTAHALYGQRPDWPDIGSKQAIIECRSQGAVLGGSGHRMACSLRDVVWLKLRIYRPANLYIRALFRISLNDTTSGFRANRRHVE